MGVGTCKWPGVHALMRRRLSWSLSMIWTSLSPGRGPHQGQFNTTNTQIHKYTNTKTNTNTNVQIIYLTHPTTPRYPYIQLFLKITQTWLEFYFKRYRPRQFVQPLIWTSHSRGTPGQAKFHKYKYKVSTSNSFPHLEITYSRGHASVLKLLQSKALQGQIEVRYRP